MSAASLTIVTPGSGLTAANFVGNGGSGSGGWSLTADVNCWNGTNMYGTSVVGDYATYTVPAGTQALYVILRPATGNGAASQANVSTFNVLLDGVQIGDTQSLAADCYAFGQALYRYPFPLFRYGAQDFSSGAHVVQLVNQNTFQALRIEGFIGVTARATAPAAGITALGDSWTVKGGATATTQGYAYRLAARLSRAAKKAIPLTNLGVNGDMFLDSFSTTRTGGMYRFVTNFLAAPTQYLTCLYGANDLSTYSVGMLLNAYHLFCGLIEDTVDLGATTVAIGTPGWRTPIAMMPSLPLADPTVASSTNMYYSGAYETFEEAVIGVRLLPRFFSWLKVADIWDVLDGRSDLFYPNGSSPVDGGNHPNDQGCEMIALEFARALIGK